MKLEQLFEGDKHHRGVLWKINKDMSDKKAVLEKKAFDWNRHFKSDENILNMQGLSPVNLDTGTVKWLGLDVDLKIEPKEFCGNVFSKLGSQLFCFRTIGHKWRVVEFFNEPLDVEVASKRAKELEARMEKVVGYKCDAGHTLPQSYNIEERKPGGWWFMPYCTKDTVCYSPGGLPLKKEQFEFRAKYKHLSLVVASVGMTSPGRHKAFFGVALCNKYLGANVNLLELNKNFNEIFAEDLSLINDIKHAEKNAEKYDKKYLLNAIPKWCKEICDVKPYLDARGFNEVTTTLADDYVYVRSRKGFYEKSSYEFIDSDQMNEFWKHIDNKQITQTLLKEPSFTRIKKYLTHAGLDEGVVLIPEGQISGVEMGEYLNIYKPSKTESVKGDIKRFNEYYSICFGEEAWLVVKKYIAFMLRAREEINENGIKIQWFIIYHSLTQGVGKGLLAQVMQSLLGTRNVRPNVSFKSLINTHSTLIEGAQLIILNEVVLTNSTGDLKEMSEQFKNLITDPHLIINPKNKPQIEIPNQCNFWVLSNGKTPLYLDKNDRRAFVINIKLTKEEAKELLINKGYKKDILEVLKNPSAFKWHLLNEIQYEREMFFEDAPSNQDKKDMILANRSEFCKKMDMAREEQSFPFANYENINSTQNQENYIYKGIINIKHLLRNLEANSEFRKSGKMYYGIDEVTDYVKSICTAWPNGETTKQMQLKNGSRPRVYLIEQNWTIKDDQKENIPLSRATELQLGKLWENDTYFEKVFAEPFNGGDNF